MRDVESVKFYMCESFTGDGVYLILLTITWYTIGVIGILLWLGYIGVTEKEIRASFKQIDGHYGMFVVFIMKHVQAEMTRNVETDVLLHCSIFYFVVGIAALFACICYIYVLADCALPESGHSIIKFAVILWYVIVFGVLLFPLGLARDGLRHLIFLDFYGAFSWMGLFLIMCFSIAVSWSQGMARVLYDFYNVNHLKGYELRTHHYTFPKIMAFLFTMLPLLSMLREAFDKNLPTQGTTDWSDTFTHVFGNILLFSPSFAVVFGAVFYYVKERTDKTQPIFSPHRDFYKNKYHMEVCFKDYFLFEPNKILQKKQKRE